ncbi:MAG TPA: undecaprenyl-diphosphate phosphatase [Tepidisphaeraceae bacterium]|jgi:undecaprenyl-diphosphatase|nr:undecaprenyl-diphosphate phosphatase [Tepidisphaeraceae bacterium]
MGELWKTIILGIVEGLTEFVPISSTGHLLLCERWMSINLDEPFWKMFTVFIQIGAILAVVVYFRYRIVQLLSGSVSGNTVSQRLVMMVMVGTIPVLVVGYLFHKWVEKYMERPVPIALALLIGGLIMIAVEWARPGTRTRQIEHLTWGQAMGIGCAQVLAVLFPGTSRSAATIIAGLVGGMSRQAAAEFSFLLAIPAMSAASGYSLLKGAGGMSGQQIMLLLVGTLVSFLVAWGVIAVFMEYIRKRTFTPFGVYRILLGVVVLVLLRRG